MNRIASILVASSIVLMAGCGKQERVREIDWAKAALARNPTLEIVDTDESAGAFTVKDTSTGRLQRLLLDDIVAGPPQPKVAVQPVTPAEVEKADVEPSPAIENTAPQTTVAAVRPGAGQPLAEGPGYSITRGAEQDHKPPPAPTIEGPGYSITREEPAATASSEPESVASNSEKRTDPIICQGDRLMRIDDETIEFTGDAVIAENGCDLYISNARIRAGGVGIIARQARVHIVNSTIGGSRGAYEASEGAEIYVAHSIFSGVGRRFDTAQMNDLGGNEYQAHH